MPSTSVKSSTNASGSIPRSTTKNIRILQTSSSSQKYQRVKAHTRNVKSSLNKGNSMSKSMCSTCKKCLFDANHDMCVVNYLSDVNARARARTVKSIKKKEWKPTGKMFKNVGYKWVPTGRNFTIVGNRTRVHQLTHGYISSELVQNLVFPTPYVPPSKKDYEILFQPFFNEYFNPPPPAISPDLVVVAAPRAVDPSNSHLSSTIDQDAPYAERLKADNTNIVSHLPQSCLRLTLEGFPFVTVNTKDYHDECSGKILRIMCRTL
ncbi:hypothetical protein Tco_0209855 [Tanacetum coccineum]